MRRRSSAQIQQPRGGRPLVVDLLLTASHVGIDLGTILLVEPEYLGDEFRRQGRELFVKALGRIALVEVEHHVVEADAVPRRQDLAVGRFGQKIGQVHDRLSPRM
jgi:hypothetical protein